MFGLKIPTCEGTFVFVNMVWMCLKLTEPVKSTGLCLTGLIMTSKVAETVYSFSMRHYDSHTLERGISPVLGRFLDFDFNHVGSI